MLSVVAAALADLGSAGVRFAPGLSQSELERVEAIAGAAFCEEHRELLQHALPTEGGGWASYRCWPDWRGWDDERIARAFAEPFDALLDHVRGLGWWMTAWGPRPDAPDTRQAVAVRALSAAPRVALLHSHRYLPMATTVFPSPVLSIYQDDAIYVGRDLSEYVDITFGSGTWRPYEPTSNRRIPFWSDVLEQVGIEHHDHQCC